MSEEREEADRAQVVCGRLGREPRKAAGGGLGERHACQIVDRDVPTRELGGDAGRERPVGRDERRRAAGLVQRLAECDRGGEGLLAFVRGVDERKALAAVFGKGASFRAVERRPAVRAVRRAQGLREEARPRLRPLVGVAMNAQHSPVHEEVPVEQAMQHRLRMPVNRVGVAVGRAADHAPARLVEIEVDAGKDDGAVGEPRDGGKKGCGGRHRARRACGDHRARGPVAQEPFRLGEDEGVATPRRVARVAFGEDFGPRLGGDAHEAERELEIVGIVGLDRGGEVVPGDVLGRKQIHQRFEVAREIDRVGWRGRHEEGDPRPEAQEVAVDLLRPALDEPRQDEAPLHGRDRRRQDARRLEGGIVARRSDEIELGLVRFSERHDAGKEHGAAAALGDERGERPGGPPRRQVDGRVRERRRIGGEGSDKGVGEKRVDEGRQERAA